MRIPTISINNCVVSNQYSLRHHIKQGCRRCSVKRASHALYRCGMSCRQIHFQLLGTTLVIVAHCFWHNVKQNKIY